MERQLLLDLALDIAQLDDCAQVLRRAVSGLNQLPDVALVRIWRAKTGDQCPQCSLADDCPVANRNRDCLHLVASAGTPQADTEADWSNTNGRFRRVPIGWRKIGRIAAEAQARTIPDLQHDGEGFADPTWVARESIHAFTGHPLIHRGQVLGVLALFTRTDLSDDLIQAMHLFAGIIGIAMANAEALSTITELRDQLALERDYLLEERLQSHNPSQIIGASPAMQTVRNQIGMVADTDATVLITGESGTGKELVASAIHDASERADKPMVRVNCAAVAPDLFESEFFGHAAGAFTGAAGERAGRFQVADGGTLFLDEIGELPLGLQGKLLRVLQEGTYERVGEDQTRTCDVRLVAATNRDLLDEVEAGRFRRDLYYRLSVFPIAIPPLRDRREDIPELARHFVSNACKRLNRSGVPCRLNRANLLDLQQYPWPGNIRELQHVIERGVILARNGKVHMTIQPPEPGAESPSAEKPASAATPVGDRVLTDTDWDQLQRQNLLLALERSNGRLGGAKGAATLLGIKPTTLLYRLKKYDIRRTWTDR